MMEEEKELQEPKWFCLRAQPRHEHIAARVLRTVYKVEVFSPRIRFRKGTVRGVEWRVESLFPNYLFAFYNPWELQIAVRYAYGVSTIVHFGEKCATIEPGVIADLRSQMDDGETKEIPDEIKPGDKAIVAAGTFKGINITVVAHLPARERVKVLMEFLGRTTEAEIPVKDLIKTGAHPLAAR